MEDARTLQGGGDISNTGSCVNGGGKEDGFHMSQVAHQTHPECWEHVEK